MDQLTQIRQQLIVLLTHIEKIRYYYLMDDRYLNQEIDAYHTSIHHFSHDLALTLQNDANNSHTSPSLELKHTYHKLLNHLSSHPLHDFQQGTILIDLQQRQNQIHQTFVHLLNVFQ